MAGGKWIRLSGEAVRDSRREAGAAMPEANPSLGGMYGADDGIMEALCLKNAEASICAFTDAPERWHF